jgi:hypothetical protein
MGPPSYMHSVADRNVVMPRVPVVRRKEGSSAVSERVDLYAADCRHDVLTYLS